MLGAGGFVLVYLALIVMVFTLIDKEEGEHSNSVDEEAEDVESGNSSDRDENGEREATSPIKDKGGGQEDRVNSIMEKIAERRQLINTLTASPTPAQARNGSSANADSNASTPPVSGQKATVASTSSFSPPRSVEKSAAQSPASTAAANGGTPINNNHRGCSTVTIEAPMSGTSC